MLPRTLRGKRRSGTIPVVSRDHGPGHGGDVCRGDEVAKSRIAVSIIFYGGIGCFHKDNRDRNRERPEKHEQEQHEIDRIIIIIPEERKKQGRIKEKEKRRRETREEDRIIAQIMRALFPAHK